MDNEFHVRDKRSATPTQRINNMIHFQQGEDMVKEFGSHGTSRSQRQKKYGLMPSGKEVVDSLTTSSETMPWL